MTVLDVDVLRRSVTRADHEGDARNPLLYFVHPQPYGVTPYSGLCHYWSRDRDYQLRATVYQESLWADAIFKAITRIAALGWEVEDSEDSTVRVKRAQELFLNADLGAGWVKFISRHLRDYLLTDNGAFVEIVRASAGPGSRIIGLVHLDSCRVTRTDDPARPVLYRDADGEEHVLKDYQVLMFADMPDAGERYNGVGMCAASRAWHRIAFMAAMEQYSLEKMTGSGATEIDILQGINEKQLQDLIATTDEEQRRKGFVYYKGKIIGTILGDQPLNKLNIPLKDVPDGFVRQEERDYTVTVYTAAIGLPQQSLKPLSGQGLGTGTQTVILDDAAEGEGLAAWLADWKQTNNERVLPTSTTFAWNNRNDIRDQKAQAEVKKLRADERATRIQAGEISPAIARQLAADDGDYPKELLPTDATAGGTLGDDEKPTTVQFNPTIAGQYPLPTAPATGPGGGALKADDDLEAARQLYMELFGEAD